MNESGKSIKPLMSITKPENFIIVHDYLDSDFTKVKLKEGGSAEYRMFFFHCNLISIKRTQWN